MSTIAEILDRLSGISSVKERLTETAKLVDRSLDWLLDHEKRLIRLEERSPPASAPTAGLAGTPTRQLSDKKRS